VPPVCSIPDDDDGAAADIVVDGPGGRTDAGSPSAASSLVAT
jgi:hypothetical protein